MTIFPSFVWAKPCHMVNDVLMCLSILFDPSFLFSYGQDLVTFTVGGSVERDNAVSLSDDNLRKYATISGDILSSDDAKIALALVKRKDLVDRLCRVIEKTPKRSLSTPLANNVTKVLVSLLRVQNVSVDLTRDFELWYCNTCS